MIGLALALAASLYDQSLVRVFERQFTDPNLNWLLIDAASGRLIGSRWPGAAEPVAVGSLVKPLTALAWAERHDGAFPEFTCAGCWRPKGHGRIGIVAAIAQSCNAYFERLAAELEFADVAAVARRFGVAAPPDDAAAWAGRGGLWRVAPLDLARALARLAGDPQAAVVRLGMAECARTGTGKAIGAGLAKTGTAPCLHARRAPGDGFAAVLGPAETPRFVLLVRVHGTTGAQAAAVAARMLGGAVPLDRGRPPGRTWTSARRTVRIGVFGLFHPTELTVRAPGAAEVRCTLESGAVACSGPVPAEGAFALSVPGKIERRFFGRLELAAEAGALIPLVEMPLETAVASAVAAESPPGAPLEALRAQAVVARSYYLAGGGRHAGFDFCDTTHCQFLREPPPDAAPAARAAADTAGLALAWEGRPIEALFTASCGGRTRALGRPDDYPYFAVECPYCRRSTTARCSYCVREDGPWPNRRGAGRGHGVGLCQTGAAAMAEEGAGFRAILERYFPNARLTAEYAEY
jgi:hypothetical protein